MLKIKCNNPACGTTFVFDETKNRKATKVMCPKCKNVQNLKGDGGGFFASSPQVDADEDFDWLKGNNKPAVNASPVFTPPIEEEKPEPPSIGMDVFAPPKIKKEAPKPPLFRQAPPQPQRTPDTEQTGWLIIHDEYTESYTFELRKGINRIGRDSDSTPRDVNIRIKSSDKYMSRHHCDIQVRWQNGKNCFEYLLADKNSSNGTFVNAGKRLVPDREVLINDGDTVQVGRTKLVLKIPSIVNNVRDAENQVHEQDFFKTIIV